MQVSKCLKGFLCSFFLIFVFLNTDYVRASAKDIDYKCYEECYKSFKIVNSFGKHYYEFSYDNVDGYIGSMYFYFPAVNNKYVSYFDNSSNVPTDYGFINNSETNSGVYGGSPDGAYTCPNTCGFCIKLNGTSAHVSFKLLDSNENMLTLNNFYSLSEQKQYQELLVSKPSEPEPTPTPEPEPSKPTPQIPVIGGDDVGGVLGSIIDAIKVFISTVLKYFLIIIACIIPVSLASYGGLWLWRKAKIHINNN